jgi:hypothetical protein
MKLGTRISIGAVAGLAVILFFLSMSDGGDPSWGKYWMIRPLVVGTFAGAMAGFCNYIILHYRALAGLNRPVAVILSVVVSIAGMWMGIVLGFNGTMWN